MRLGLIGLGRIGAFHAQTLHDLDRVDSLVVTDADPDVTATVAARVCAEPVDSPEKLFAAGVDGVLIAAATAAHPALLLAAVEAGLPVFCEKPLAADIADALVTSPSQLLLNGKMPGTISMFVWDRGGTIRRYEVIVQRDRARRNAAGAQNIDVTIREIGKVDGKAQCAVMIADDEAPARRKLVRFLGQHDDVEIVAEASNGLDALDLIAMTKPHVVFLDINMPDLDGLGVAETLARSEKPPSIVFVTAFNEYAVKAFEVSALDYLLKPYDRDRFEQALHRARRTAAAAPDADALAETLARIRNEERYVRRLLIPGDGRSFFLATCEITRFESEGNNVVVHSHRGTSSLRATLESLETRLGPQAFARVHRSHLVNIDEIAEIHPWFHGDYKIVMRDGTEIAWSRRYAGKRPDLLK